MESRWILNAGLLGNQIVALPYQVWRWNRAGLYLFNSWDFLTNGFPRSYPLALFAIVLPGTGVPVSFRLREKPAGPGSSFPYGFAVVPDSLSGFDV